MKLKFEWQNVLKNLNFKTYFKIPLMVIMRFCHRMKITIRTTIKGPTGGGRALVVKTTKFLN